MYPYFDIVLGFVWSHDPESCAGSSVATGRAFHLGKVKGDDTDKKGYLGPPLLRSYIATWNVLCLYRAGMLQQVKTELKKHRTDIAAVQEIRWKGSGGTQVIVH